MTSTVLDVTVLLLCVSASVVALGAGDGGGPDGPTAAGAADRLVTETATVTYPNDGGPNGTLRVHATRAELLALLAARDADEPFDRRAARTVRSGVGSRTRVDVEVRHDETGASAPRESVWSSETGGAWDPRTSPAPWQAGGWAANGSVRFRTDGGSVPTSGGADPATAAEDEGPIVVIGPKPPRDADVSAAVVRQPLPDGPDGEADVADASATSVRIVVRRW